MKFFKLRFYSREALFYYDYDYDYAAHSPSGLFSDRLHELLRLLILPTKLGLFIFTTIVILLSYNYVYPNPPC
jgi:hypothetical protein